MMLHTKYQGSISDKTILKFYFLKSILAHVTWICNGLEQFELLLKSRIRFIPAKFGQTLTSSLGGPLKTTHIQRPQ